MFLTECSVSSLRIFETLRFEPGAGINLFFGENASGKTSLLESIYFLSRAKSFRTVKSAELIRRGERRVFVAAVLEGNGGKTRLCIEKSSVRMRIKANEEPVGSASMQALQFPVLAWLTDSARLFTETPKLRRHWLNWSLFHVKPRFLEVWKAYHRALRHRNAVLRRKQEGRPEMPFWEQTLSAEAQTIDELRGEYVRGLEEQWSAVVRRLLDVDASIVYRRGWDDGTPLCHRLSAQRELDQQRGYTTSGPHRADVVFRAGGRAVSSWLSRGHLKLYGAGLLLGQALCMVRQTGQMPLILMDDVDAELDTAGQKRLFGELSRLSAQCFVTTLNPSLAELLGDSGARVFHVKQGAVEVLQ